MARTRVRRRRLAISIVVLSLTAFLMGPVTHAFVAGAEARHEPHHTYVVRSGDTLWGIAARQLPAGADPRPLIAAIGRVNGVTAAELVPGRALVIPASAH